MERGYCIIPLMEGSKVEDVNLTNTLFNVMFTISESGTSCGMTHEEQVTIVERIFILLQNGQEIKDNFKFLKSINHHDDIVHIFEVTT